MKRNNLDNKSINVVSDIVKHRQQIALFLCKQGFSLLPLKPASKIPYYQLLPTTREGQASWNLYSLRCATESEVKDWFICDPECNYGILTGHGFYVLDVDNVRKLPKESLPPTVTVKSGKGIHYYYKCEQELPGKKFDFGELKSEGGYIVGPGSVHKNGKVYEFYDMLSLAEIEIAILPEWLQNSEAARAAPPLSDPKDPKTSNSENLKTGRGIQTILLVCHMLLKGLKSWRG